MKKVRIESINGYNYVLVDSDERKYQKNIEFMDTKLAEGDYIYISDDVLNEENIYTYGPINDSYKEEDIIKIIHNDKEIYLQRYYG